MKFAIIFILFFSFSSCRNFNSDAQNTHNVVTLGKIITKNRFFDEQESVLISQICAAFEYKRTNFTNDFWNKTFRFKVEKQPCQGSSTSTSIVNAQITNQMYFSSNDDYPFEQIQTDDQGVMKNICEQHEKSLANSLIFQHHNTSTVSFGKVLQLRFSKNDQYNKVFAVFAQQNSDDNYIINEVYEYFVSVESNQSPSLRGFIPITNHLKLCDNASKISRVSSTYLD